MISIISNTCPIVDSEICPFRLFELYLSKLPEESDDMWQQPVKKRKTNDAPYYYPKPVGKNMLAEAMKRLSVKAKLSESYTNHCVRCTTMYVLDNCGVEARHIIAVTGHKTEATIKKSYATKCPKKKFREMFDHLGNAFHDEREDRDDYSPPSKNAKMICNPESVNSSNVTKPIVTSHALEPIASSSKCQAVEPIANCIDDDFIQSVLAQCEQSDQNIVNQKIVNEVVSVRNSSLPGFNFSNCAITINFNK